MASTLIEVVRAGGDAGAILDCPLPETYRAAFTRREDEGIFAADETDWDVRASLHVGEVPLPPIAPDEVLIAVMASAVNYNTVWSAMFLPISTFRFLDQFARQGSWAARHGQPFHVLGSDLAEREGLGIEDPITRERIGEDRLRLVPRPRRERRAGVTSMSPTVHGPFVDGSEPVSR